MTDILFTHSYFLKFDPKEHLAMMPYPPLGTLYAAACARDADYSVALFDSMLAESEYELTAYLERHSPRFLVIYDDDFNYLTKMCLTRMRKAAFRMAEIAKQHGCVVIVHSSDATDHLRKYFDNHVDYALVGEAEQTLVELLDRLNEKTATSLREIPGLAYSTHEGELVTGAKRPVIRNLDTLPFPARDLVDIERYRKLWKKHHGYFSLNMVTTRGCPFHCNWCAKPLYGQVYNTHSPSRIAEELQHVKEHYTPDHIWFCDDIFGLKPGWMQEFAERVQALGVATPFKCLSRADLILRGNTAQALRNAGCQTVWIGAESGAQKILDAMEKGTTVEQIYEATAALKGEGIRVGHFLQFGYPGEEEQEVEATLQMVRETAADEIGISVSYPLPGTPFYQRVQKEMGKKQNWSESADLAMMFQGAYPTQFYRVLARYLHMDHRLRQGAQAMSTFARTGTLPGKSGLRRIALLPFYAANRIRLAYHMNRYKQPVNRTRPAHNHVQTEEPQEKSERSILR